MVRIGCSGWNYAHWRELVYPKGLPARRWLAYYAELFDTVEVNNTFYRLPSTDAVSGWGSTWRMTLTRSASSGARFSGTS